MGKKLALTFLAAAALIAFAAYNGYLKGWGK